MSKLPTAERIKVNSDWKLIGHSHQIADTGDYDGHYEITNGKISLLTQDDDDESLQPIVDALNDSGCKFYQDDWFEFENKILQEDVAGLRERVKELEGRYNRLNANYVDMVAENTRYRQALESIATRWNKVAEHNEMRTALHLIQQDVFEALKNNKTMSKTKYRECPHCKRVVPPQYDFPEHKRLCKGLHTEARNFIMGRVGK